MSYQIHLRADPGYEGYGPLITDSAQAVLEHLNAPKGAVSVVLTSSEYITHLNSSYRGRQEPTDVLSFPDGDEDPETQKKYFGDVVIAVPEAERQAQEAAHSTEDELRLLVVHGMLHLLGFTHDEDSSQERMWAVQSTILEYLGNKILTPGITSSHNTGSSEGSEAT